MILSPSEDALLKAAECLGQGGLIAFPTETYYGLGVDPFNRKALQRLFAVKGRAAAKPVLVLIENQTQVSLLAAQVPDALQKLMGRFWPGPLTVVCPARSDLPDLLTGGTGTVGIRQSPDPTAARLLAAFGRPVTATSANCSGQPAAVTAAEVQEIFGSQIDLILDGGTTPGGLSSTLIGCDEHGRLRCLRKGRIPWPTEAPVPL